MAGAILGEDKLACKTQSTVPFNETLPERWFDIPGLVDVSLVDEDAQIAILGLIDETGSARLADLIALLPDHPKPGKAVLHLVHLGILSIEDGLVDGNSLLRRRTMLQVPKAQGSAGPEGQGGAPARGTGKLQRLAVVRPQPEIFFANWSDRAAFKGETALTQRGCYLALYLREAYVGRSDRLIDRLLASKHLLAHGIPDLVIAVVDRNNILTPAQIRLAERLLARQVQRHGVLKLANDELPVGEHLPFSEFAPVDRFVRETVRALSEGGLAFMSKGAPLLEMEARDPEIEPCDRPETLEPEEARHYALHACGVHATALARDGNWTVLTGSQVRTDIMPSAGSGIAQQRRELLLDGILVQNGDHLLLTQDVSFTTASGAARFVVGSRHKPEIWQALPQPAPFDGLFR
jgi:hypothetical protein